MCEEATNSRADCDCEQEVRVSGRACGDACWVPSVRMGTAHLKDPFSSSVLAPVLCRP